MTEPVIIHTLASNPIFKAALGGALTAASIDYHAFLQWKSVKDATTYNWGMAILRWLQGAVSGAVVAAGLGSFL